MTLTFRVTYVITECVLQPFSRKSAPGTSMPWPWPFMVTWRHRSCDHLIPQVLFPIVALL